MDPIAIVLREERWMMRTLLLLAACAFGFIGVVRADEDWSHHVGDIPFIHGYDQGVAESKFSGKPLMVFFTSPT